MKGAAYGACGFRIRVQHFDIGIAILQRAIAEKTNTAIISLTHSFFPVSMLEVTFPGEKNTTPLGSA